LNFRSRHLMNHGIPLMLIPDFRFQIPDRLLSEIWNLKS